MTRRVIPIAEHLSEDPGTRTASNYRSFLLGVTLIILHLASIVLALTYF